MNIIECIPRLTPAKFVIFANHEQGTEMTRCPECYKRIPFRTIFFALCPVWITCPHCKTKLAGDKFIVIQGFVLVIIALCTAIAALKLVSSTTAYFLVMAPIVLLMAAVATFITQVKGKYRRRGGKATRVPDGF